MAVAGAIVTQLIDVETRRAFPNQFEITVSSSQGEETSEEIKNFSFYAKRISLGSYSLEQDRITSIQHTIIKKATVPDTISLTVKESDGWSILKYFYKWYVNYYYNPQTNLFRTGGAGKRKTFTIYALSPPYNMTSAADGIDQNYSFQIVVKDALLVGPINLPDFTYDASDPVDHTFTLQSDNIQLLWNESASAGATPSLKGVDAVDFGTRLA